MIINYDTLAYVNSIVGKPIVCVFNDVEDKWYYFIADEFVPKNPSNNIHDNFLLGKEIHGLLTSISGFSHGVNSVSDVAIFTKIEELVSIKYTFCGFKWIKIQS